MKIKKLHAVFIVIAAMAINLAHVLDCRAEFSTKRFKCYKNITLEEGAAGKNYRVVLDRDIYNESQESLRDLRLVLNDEIELPYQIYTYKRESKTLPFNLSVRENYVIDNNTTVLVVDLAQSGIKHNKLDLKISGHNFGRRVKIEGSDDAENWQVLANDKYIYDFTFGADAAKAGYVSWARVVDNKYMADFSYTASSRNTTVAYNENTQRYLKITVYGTKEDPPLLVEEVKIYRDVVEPADEARYPCAITANEIKKEQKTSEVILDLGAANLPVYRLEIVSNSKNYYRSVYLQGSRDMKEWVDIGKGDIFDYNIENFTDANRVINFNEARVRYFKLIIFNQDNQPINIIAASGTGLNRSVVFPYQEKGDLRIYYGNEFMDAPQYDYARFVGKIDGRKLEKLPLGRQLENKSYLPEKAKKPWTEERPYLLWVVIIGIIGAMLFSTAAMLKKIK